MLPPRVWKLLQGVPAARGDWLGPAVRVVVSPTASDDGFAEPLPVGGVGLSSLRIVPVADAVLFVAPTMFVTFTLNVSFGSTSMSPFTRTVKVYVVETLCALSDLAT